MLEQQKILLKMIYYTDDKMAFPMTTEMALSVLHLATEHKLFPFIFPKICSLLPVNERCVLEKEYLHNRSKADRYLAEICLVKTLLSEHHIPFRIIKGLPLSQMLYGSPYDRTVGDIDLLVSPDDFEQVYLLLQDLGYRQWTYYDAASDHLFTTNSSALNLRSDYFEYTCVKESENGRIFLEIKKATSAIGSDRIMNFFRSAFEIALSDECSVPTFDLVHTFIHLCMNIFSNGESTQVLQAKRKAFLRDYVDLYWFIKKYLPLMNLPELLMRIDFYHLAREINRVLYDLFMLSNDKNAVSWWFSQDRTIENTYFPLQITNGTLYAINWQTPIPIRLFDFQANRAEYIKFYKLAHYSASNPYLSDCNARYFTDSDAFVFERYMPITFSTCEITVCVQFQLLYWSERFYLSLGFKKDMLLLFEDHEFQFVLFDNDPCRDIVFQTISVSAFSNRSIFWNCNGTCRGSSEILQEWNNFVYFSVVLPQSFRMIPTAFLCYALALFKVYTPQHKQRIVFQYGVLKRKDPIAHE